MNKFLMILLLISVNLIADDGKREYFHYQLTQSDKSNIQYIINNLAHKSLFQLMFHQSQLQKVGDATAHIHPLLYFKYILTNPQLKQEFHQLYQRNGKIWREFQNGFVKSFESSKAKDNITSKMVENFASQTGVNPKVIELYIDHDQWKDFLNYIATN